jgi:hypothetical protein
MLASGILIVAWPLLETVPCNWPKVNVSATSVFFTETKLSTDLVLFNNHRAATLEALLLLRLVLVVCTLLLLRLLLVVGILLLPGTLLLAVPPQATPLRVKLVGFAPGALVWVKPNATVPLAGKLPL